MWLTKAAVSKPHLTFTAGVKVTGTRLSNFKVWNISSVASRLPEKTWKLNWVKGCHSDIVRGETNALPRDCPAASTSRPSKQSTMTVIPLTFICGTAVADSLSSVLSFRWDDYLTARLLSVLLQTLLPVGYGRFPCRSWTSSTRRKRLSGITVIGEISLDKSSCYSE